MKLQIGIQNWKIVVKREEQGLMFKYIKKSNFIKQNIYFLKKVQNLLIHF